MVSSASAVEEAALKNGLSLKTKMAQEDESPTGSVKNGRISYQTALISLSGLLLLYSVVFKRVPYLSI